MKEKKLTLGHYGKHIGGNKAKSKSRETYRDQGGLGVGWLVPVAGEGSCDAFLELSCTKDHFQCLVSIMTLKC